METAKTAGQILNELPKKGLTAASEPQTKASPVNTKAWADWLKLQTHNDPEIENLVQKCAEFALAFKNGGSPRWITLLGVTGTGKTHCASRMWNFFRWYSDSSKTAFNPSKIYWPAFVSKLKTGECFNHFRDMWTWPVLMLDDIGADRDTTGFSTEQLNTLLGCRVRKWTIITSNLTLRQLSEVEPRIADRIIRKPNIFVEVKTKSHSLR